MQKIKELIFKVSCYTTSYSEIVMYSLFLVFVFVMAVGA